MYITSRIYSSYCVLDTGKNNFAIFHLDKDGHQKDRICTFYEPHKSKKVSGLLAHSYYKEYLTDVYDTDTLTYKFGDFIEYNNKPGNLPVKLITLKAWTDYEDFNLTIYGDTREARLGEYGPRTTIDSMSYQRLVDIINYTNFNNLKRVYPPDKKYHVLSLSVEL